MLLSLTADVGNLISGSCSFSKTSLNIRKFTVHILLKPGLENFEHYFTSMWDECNCAVVWAFFGILWHSLAPRATPNPTGRGCWAAWSCRPGDVGVMDCAPASFCPAPRVRASSMHGWDSSPRGRVGKGDRALPHPHSLVFLDFQTRGPAFPQL